MAALYGYSFTRSRFFRSATLPTPEAEPQYRYHQREPLNTEERREVPRLDRQAGLLHSNEGRVRHAKGLGEPLTSPEPLLWPADTKILQRHKPVPGLIEQYCTRRAHRDTTRTSKHFSTTEAH